MLQYEHASASLVTFNLAPRFPRRNFIFARRWQGQGTESTILVPDRATRSRLFPASFTTGGYKVIKSRGKLQSRDAVDSKISRRAVITNFTGHLSPGTTSLNDFSGDAVETGSLQRSGGRLSATQRRMKEPRLVIS